MTKREIGKLLIELHTNHKIICGLVGSYKDREEANKRILEITNILIELGED